jgi:hypothetical protein
MVLDTGQKGSGGGSIKMIGGGGTDNSILFFKFGKRGEQNRQRGQDHGYRGVAKLLAQSINEKFGFNAREKCTFTIYLGQHFDHFGLYRTRK